MVTSQPIELSPSDFSGAKKCFASVGYRGSAQTISLQVPQCIFFGVIQHEFLHAIGFHHEHCRSDRNKYVRIFWENVMPDLQYNFNLLQTNNLGTEYDYDSVMHYGKTVFSRNGFPTILPIPDPRVEIGHMRGLSNKDVAKINKLYNCDVCGYMLATRIGSFTSPNFPGLYPNNADCKWLIRIARRYKQNPSQFKIYFQILLANTGILALSRCLGETALRERDPSGNSLWIRDCAKLLFNLPAFGKKFLYL
ncbi:astacin-like metalloendopeptidase [Scyliorhinus torazame]|uniref:astacin-like metalloendopeptidase n=1 Tax=Scyliorhinus torazame TaxID=75743 RepID=UPI003B58F09A